MHLKPTDTETLGIEQDGPFLRAAALSIQKGQPALDYLIEIPLPEANLPEDVNPLYISDDAKLLRSIFAKRLSVTGLNAQEVIARRLVIKLLKDKDVDAAFSFQAEPMLPYPLTSAVIDKITLQKADGATQLTLLAARKDHLKTHLEHWAAFDLEPEVVSAEPLALAAFAGTFIPSDELVCVIHLARQSLICALVKKGKLIASSGNDFGVQQILTTNDPAHIEALEQEIRRMVLFLKKELKLKEDCPLCFTGEGALLNNIPNHIGTALNHPVIAISPPSAFNASVEQLLKFALPIGLALSCLTTFPDPINFRQDEYAYPSPWKRFLKPLSFFAVCCFLLAIGFYIFAEAYVSYNLAQSREHYMDLLTQLRKPYKQFEIEYAAKQPGGKLPSEDEIIPVEKLDRQQLLNRLEFLQKQIASLPDTYSLYPNVPLVSDFLAWLSNHPKVKCTPEDKATLDGESCDGIQLDSLSYTMAKRPDQAKKAEKYQVKVDLDFSAPTPTLAREFHDALIAPNEMVDPKGEVKWSSNRGKYRASFFLKDKFVVLNAPKAEVKRDAE